MTTEHVNDSGEREQDRCSYEPHGGRQCLQHSRRRERQVADAHARGIGHGVGHHRQRRHDAHLADTAHPILPAGVEIELKVQP